MLILDTICAYNDNCINICSAKWFNLNNMTRDWREEHGSITIKFNYCQCATADPPALSFYYSHYVMRWRWCWWWWWWASATTSTTTASQLCSASQPASEKERKGVRSRCWESAIWMAARSNVMISARGLAQKDSVCALYFSHSVRKIRYLCRLRIAMASRCLRW